MRNRQIIFVAEDGPYIALDLASAVEDADGRVIGPAGSAQEARELLNSCTVDGAIVDVNLVDGDSAQVRYTTILPNSTRTVSRGDDD